MTHWSSVTAVYGPPPPYEPCASESCDTDALYTLNYGIDSAGKTHGPYCEKHAHMAVVDRPVCGPLSELETYK